MYVSRTPDKIDAPTLGFCKSVNRSAGPVYVTVTPEPWAEANDCFMNVRRIVEEHGGEELNGWQVWTWPRVFIEAEHHCVWIRPDGTLLDITPKQNSAQRILFIPDPDKVYDHTNHRRFDNVRRALVRDRDVSAFLENGRRLYELMEASSEGTGRTAYVDPVELERLQEHGADLFIRIFERHAGKNAPCLCGNGRKFKKCHGRSDLRLGNSFRNG